MIRKHIPNALTCGNLLSGCIAIVHAFEGQLQTAAYFILLSGIFDFFDGFAARLLHVKSDIGKELDSLADMVSFGFLPGVLMFQLFKMAGHSADYLPYFGFVITIFSALRLAKFNIDERQSVDFIGLNTPMNTLFIVSLPFIQQDYPAIVGSPWILVAITVVCSLLLVSELKLFSLKLTGGGWSKNRFRFIFLILSLVLIAILKFAAIPFILVLYIATSVLHFKSAGAE